MIDSNTKESIKANIILKSNPYSDPNAIKDTISYIYRLNDAQRNNLPIYCYGIPYFPPTYPNLIQSFHEIRSLQANAPAQQVFHIIISFDLPLPKINTKIYHYIDTIAWTFGQSYPICYAYHNTEGHPHFHYIISATSYLNDVLALDRDKLNSYFAEIADLSSKYNITPNFIDKE